MDILDLYSDLMSVFDSRAFSLIVSMTAIYLGVLWVAIVIWVARDIVQRSNNLFFQVFSILLGFAFLPGLILYLIVRPTKTLADRYGEELERRAFLESISETDEECRNCNGLLRRDFIFCPNCQERIRKVCGCGQVLEAGWSVCPTCGKQVEEDKPLVKGESKAETSSKKRVAKDKKSKDNK